MSEMAHDTNESDAPAESATLEPDAAVDRKVLAVAEKRRPPNAGIGRVAGVPNKVTSVVRELFAAFVETNVEKVQELFDRVAKDDPKGALEILVKFSEFVLPKLTRTTVDGELAVMRGELVTPDFTNISRDEAVRAYLALMDGGQ
jgi:hypothetical protein